MTPNELAVAAEMARGDLYFFSRLMFKSRKGMTWQRARHHKTVCDALMRVYRGECSRLILNLPPRYSKAIDCDTPMWTPQGWRRAGDIAVGDMLIGSDGQWTEVLGVHPQGVRPAFDVRFSDGVSLVACGDHRWSVRQRYGGPDRVKTTDELAGDLCESDGRNKWRIPVLVDGRDVPADLPIDPYLLGCWLGDGHSHYAAITSMDPEIVAAFAEFDPKPHAHQSGGRATTYGLRNGFVTRLRALGVLKNKHIPATYMQGSHAQRLALLQGLCDTDGWVGTANGQQGFAASNERLSDDFRSLVSSLGGVWRGFSSQPARGKRSFKTFLSMADGDVAFRLPRKLAQINPRAARNMPRRFVSSITPVEPREMVCFTVAADDHLFCAGRDFVVTHNTELSVVNFMAWCMGKQPDSEFLHLSYSSDLADGNSWNAREVVADPMYRSIFPATELDPAQKAKEHWRTTAGGVVYAAGFEGTITGKGAGKMRDPDDNRFGGCFPYAQQIQTEHGNEAIGDVVARGGHLRVPSLNESTGEVETRAVLTFWRNPANDIVRVHLNDGTSFDCTPDHEVLTSGGWIAALHLAQPLNLMHGQASQFDSLLPGELRVDGDGYDEVRVLWLCVPVGVRQVLRYRYPRLAQLDLPDDAADNAVSISELARAFRGLEYLHSLVAIENGAGPALKNGERAVPKSVLHVVGLCAVREIARRVVGGASVEMPNLIARGSWAYELLSDQMCNVAGHDLAIDGEVDPKITLAVGTRLKRSQRDGAPDLSEIGHLIKPGSAGNVTPLFVEYVGHVGETFCLEVEGNSNFILSQSGAVVSNCIIIDDPHKANEALSEKMLSNVRTGFTTTIESRKNDRRTPIIVVMQRLHTDDLAGWLEAGGNGEKWEVVRIPVLDENDEPIWPEKHDRATLQAMEDANPYVFAGQYRQLPAPPAGGNFQPGKIQTIDALPASITGFVRGWDLAASKDSGAWTVGLKLARDQKTGRTIICDVERMRGAPHEVRQTMLATAQRDGPSTLHSIPQDPGQAGKVQVADFAVLLNGFRVKFSPESGDKIMRADPFASQVNVGNVDMLRGAWNNALIEEMRLFPNSTKDQIDAASRAFAEMDNSMERFRALAGM